MFESAFFVCVRYIISNMFPLQHKIPFYLYFYQYVDHFFILMSVFRETRNSINILKEQCNKSELVTVLNQPDVSNSWTLFSARQTKW